MIKIEEENILNVDKLMPTRVGHSVCVFVFAHASLLTRPARTGNTGFYMSRFKNKRSSPDSEGTDVLVGETNFLTKNSSVGSKNVKLWSRHTEGQRVPQRGPRGGVRSVARARAHACPLPASLRVAPSLAAA